NNGAGGTGGISGHGGGQRRVRGERHEEPVAFVVPLCLLQCRFDDVERGHRPAGNGVSNLDECEGTQVVRAHFRPPAVITSALGTSARGSRRSSPARRKYSSTCGSRRSSTSSG